MIQAIAFDIKKGFLFRNEMFHLLSCIESVEYLDMTVALFTADQVWLELCVSDEGYNKVLLARLRALVSQAARSELVVIPTLCHCLCPGVKDNRISFVLVVSTSLAGEDNELVWADRCHNGKHSRRHNL